jgi:L-amino acid N-acyltransferase
MQLRLADESDAAAIALIYNYEVEHTTATFDLVVRSLEEQRQWLAARSGAFSCIVAEHDGVIAGFCALSTYKERAAYRTSVEDSVYVDRAFQGQGVGRLLLENMISVAQESGFHTVIARIEASGTSSRALHARCGFELVGVEKEVGRKFGRWLDVAIMQRLL